VSTVRKPKLFVAIAVVLFLSVLVGCSQQRANTPAMKDNVNNALTQNSLGQVKVDEDRDKGVITLKGDVETQAKKEEAERVAKEAAPGRVIANEIAVRPEGQEGTAKTIDKNTDDAIENEFRAQIAAHHWDDQHIHFNAKNGVLTLTGDVDTPQQRQETQQVAAKVPGVQQVVNELTVKSAKGQKASTNRR
jgi:hyperosmotically inducible periplasmic protein